MTSLPPSKPRSSPVPNSTLTAIFSKAEKLQTDTALIADYEAMELPAGMHLEIPRSYEQLMTELNDFVISRLPKASLRGRTTGAAIQ